MADGVLHGMGHLLVPVNMHQSVNHVSGSILSGMCPVRTQARLTRKCSRQADRAPPPYGRHPAGGEGKR